MITRYLPYTLTLTSPLLLRTPGGDPNSARTLHYIPGAAIRGAVAAGTGGDQSRLDRYVLGADPAAQVRCLNAYPVLNGQRSLPVPMSLRGPKPPPDGDDWVHHDLLAHAGRPHLGDLADPDLDEDRLSWPAQQLGRPLGEFVHPGATRSAVTPAVSVRLHHQRDRTAGRPYTRTDGTARGAVFAYESLDAGQQFGGVLLLRAGSEPDLTTLEEELHGLLGDQVRLGRSRSAGYGGAATVSWEQPREREVPAGPPAAAIPAGQPFTVQLTAPYLGRCPSTGQPDPGQLQQELEDRLPGAKVRRVCWGFTEAGGYNRAWGLPLPSPRAVAAGSVLLLDTETDVFATAVRTLLDDGLGERRLDGYGRCALLTAPPTGVVRLHRPRPPQPGAAPAGTNLTVLIERRIATERLSRRLDRVAAELVRSAETLPTTSLIGRLRVPLRSGPDTGLAVLNQWLGETGSESARLAAPARKQVDRCRLTTTEGRATLAAWLAGLAKPGAGPPVDPAPDAQSAHAAAAAALASWLSAPEQTARQRAYLIDVVLAGIAVRVRRERGGADR